MKISGGHAGLAAFAVPSSQHSLAWIVFEDSYAGQVCTYKCIKMKKASIAMLSKLIRPSCTSLKEGTLLLLCMVLMGLDPWVIEQICQRHAISWVALQ